MNIPDNIVVDLRAAELACIAKNGECMSGYALTYIKAVPMAMHEATNIGMSEKYGLKTQILYVLGNLGWWHGEKARASKKVLKEYTS